MLIRFVNRMVIGVGIFFLKVNLIFFLGEVVFLMFKGVFLFLDVVIKIELDIIEI